MHFSPARDAGVQAKCVIGECRGAGVTWRRGHRNASFFPLITAPEASCIPHRSPALLSGNDKCGCLFLKWLSRKTHSNHFLVLWWWREWMGVLKVPLAACSVSLLCVCVCSKGSNCLLHGSIYLSVFITSNKLTFRTGW